MRIIQAITDGFVLIGKQGENNATQIQFPVVETWKSMFGENGVFQLLILRPTENTPYAVPVTADANVVMWDVSGTDLEIPGIGGCELRYIVDETLAKSQSYVTLTKDAIGGSDAPYPTPWEEWVDQVLQAGADAVGYAADAESSAEAASASETAAEAAKEAAQAAATGAAESQDAAETAASNAATSEANAAESEGNAADSAAEALLSKNAAVQAKTDAQTFASNAGVSASAAAVSATNAAASASSASASATAAGNSASAAASDQATASAARDEAVAAASSAATSETNAETAQAAAEAAQEAAETAESSAASSASAASSSATAAGNSATAAEVAQTAAEAAQAAAEAAQAAAEESAATFEVDTTLTISGKAADAKAAGDDIRDIKDTILGHYTTVKAADGTSVTVVGENVILDSLEIIATLPYESGGYTKAGLRQRSDNLYVQYEKDQNIDVNTGGFKKASAYEIIGPIDVRNADRLYFNIRHGGATYALTVGSYLEDLTFVRFVNKTSYSDTKTARDWDVTNDQYIYMSCRAADTYKWVGTYRKNSFVNFTDGGEPLTIYGGTFNFKTGELISMYASDGTELAEPVIYMQEPIQIDLINGNNTFFGIQATTDYTYTGSISATYLVSSIPDMRSDIDDMEQDITTITGEIDTMSESISGIGATVTALKADIVPIPSYYEDQVAANILTVRGNMVSVGANGFTFFFITDSHWNLNSKNSPALIQRIGKTLSIDTIVHGGDVVRDSGTTSNNADAVSSIRALKRTGKVFVALGNHDFYYKTTGDDTLKTYTPNEIFGLLQQQESYWMKEYANGHYYTDISGYKTRIIFLNTGAVDGTSTVLDSEQSEFLTNALSTTPSGWHIILCQHIWWKATTVTNFATAVGEILDNYNANAESPAHVEAVFVGHNHSDRNGTTSGGIPVIETTCDRRTDSETQTGTVNEQAFDTVTIDYENKIVYMVRTGRGNSRTISYGEESEPSEA